VTVRVMRSPLWNLLSAKTKLSMAQALRTGTNAALGTAMRRALLELSLLNHGGLSALGHQDLTATEADAEHHNIINGRGPTPGVLESANPDTVYGSGGSVDPGIEHNQRLLQQQDQIDQSIEEAAPPLDPQTESRVYDKLANTQVASAGLSRLPEWLQSQLINAPDLGPSHPHLQKLANLIAEQTSPLNLAFLGDEALRPLAAGTKLAGASEMVGKGLSAAMAAAGLQTGLEGVQEGRPGKVIGGGVQTALGALGLRGGGVAGAAEEAAAALTPAARRAGGFASRLGQGLAGAGKAAVIGPALGLASQTLADSDLAKSLIPDDETRNAVFNAAGMGIGVGGLAMAAGRGMKGLKESTGQRVYHGSAEPIEGPLRANLTPDDHVPGVSVSLDPREAGMYGTVREARLHTKNPISYDDLETFAAREAQKRGMKIDPTDFSAMDVPPQELATWLKAAGYDSIDYTGTPGLGYGIRVLDPALVELQPPATQRVATGDLSAKRAAGEYDLKTGAVTLDRASLAKLSPDQRAELVRHELAHKIDTESELWKTTDSYLWREWEKNPRNPIFDYMTEKTGSTKFNNAVAPEILAHLYANDYPKKSFTVTERPVPYEHEAGQTGAREYPIPGPLMNALHEVEGQLGIWGKKGARGTAPQGAPRFHVVTLESGQWHPEDSFHTKAEAQKYIKNSAFWDGMPRKIVDALDRAALAKADRGEVPGRFGADPEDTVHDRSPEVGPAGEGSALESAAPTVQNRVQGMPTTASLVKTLKKGGGFTVDTKTGVVPDTGTMVGLYPNGDKRVLVVPVRRLTAQMVDDYLTKMAPQLAGKERYLGGWVSGKNAYLDVPLRVVKEAPQRVSKSGKPIIESVAQRAGRIEKQERAAVSRAGGGTQWEPDAGVRERGRQIATWTNDAPEIRPEIAAFRRANGGRAPTAKELETIKKQAWDRAFATGANERMVGDPRGFLESPTFERNAVEMADEGLRYLQEKGVTNPEWWKLRGTVWERLYADRPDGTMTDARMKRVAGFLAATAPNAGTTDNVRQATEYLRRMLNKEPIIQPEWRAQPGVNVTHMEAGKMMPMETVRANNLELAMRKRGDLMNEDKVREEFKALTGDPNAQVLDTQLAKIGEVPESGVYLNATAGRVEGKAYQVMATQLRRIATKLGRQPRDFTAEVWTGIRETIRRTGELFGRKFKRPVGESYGYDQILEREIAFTAKKLGVTPLEVERRIKAGHMSTLAALLSTGGVAAQAAQQWLAQQSQDEAPDDAGQSTSDARSGA
jgi:hypothetical protein